MEPVYKYRAVCVRVIDGDSIVCDISLGFGVWLRKQIIRLRGINTPEIRGVERPEGLKSKKFVQEALFKISGAPDSRVPRALILETYKDKKGKYGRWIAEVWFYDPHPVKLNWVSLNDVLVEQGLAERREY